MNTLIPVLKMVLTISLIKHLPQVKVQLRSLFNMVIILIIIRSKLRSKLPK